MARITWKSIQTEAEFQEAIAESKERTVIIFKHSTRCSVSFMAKKSLEMQWDIEDDKASIYYLDLIAFRPISNLIAQELGVDHQSPQAIVLKNEVVVDARSHSDISVDALHPFV